MPAEMQNNSAKGRGVAVVVTSLAFIVATAFRSLSVRFRSLGAELTLA